MTTTVYVVSHEGNALPATELKQVTDAVQYQVTQHFAPIWNRHVNIVTIPTGQTVPDGGVLAVCQKTIDVPGALAYHTVSGGRPEIVVSLELAQKVGDSFSVAFGHEVLEMLCDRWCTATVADGTGKFWIREVCDPVQTQSYKVSVDGVSVDVPNFVGPRWFDPKRSGPLDFLGRLSEPWEVAPGGYAQYADGKGVHQVLGKDVLDRIAHRHLALGALKRGTRVRHALGG
jgi:hypothetical protein